MLVALFKSDSRKRSLKSKTLNTKKSAVYNVELFSNRFGPGSGCQKNLKINRTRNYYFKTIGYTNLAWFVLTYCTEFHPLILGPGTRFLKVPVPFRARKAVFCLPGLCSRSNFK